MSEVPIPDAPEEPPAREGRLLHRLQPMLTLVIAFSAIGLAIWEGAENRRHNRLSVQPRLGAEINSGRDNAGEFVRMSVESTGLGPAVIKTFRIYFDGVPQDSIRVSGGTAWQLAIDAFADSVTHVNAHSIGSGYYLPAGREQILFEARRSRPTSDNDLALTAILARLALQVCYCSIYNTDCDEVLLTTVPFEAPGCISQPGR
jgi:hypothetical protein